MRTPFLSAMLLMAALLLPAPQAGAQTIDQAYVQQHDYADMSPVTRANVGAQVWMFTHASVGANILDGMSALHDQDPQRYPLVRAEGDPDHPPQQARPGTIYDLDRGNPMWNEKFDLFRKAVAGGWGNVADFAMDKLCYIDQDADPDAYLRSMAGLEQSSRPTLVYTTMPLTTEADSENDLRNAYNRTVRAYAAKNDRLLFDIADLEAHDAQGRECSYTSGGQRNQRLCPGWTDDGGHLDGSGQVRLAKAWYAMAGIMAEILYRPAPAGSMTVPGTGWSYGSGNGQ